METVSALLALCAGNSPVPGEFPAQRPVTRSFDVFFDLRLNKRLSKQSWGWWFETPSRPLWRQCNGYSLMKCILWCEFCSNYLYISNQRDCRSIPKVTITVIIYRKISNGLIFTWLIDVNNDESTICHVLLPEYHDESVCTFPYELILWYVLYI